MSPLARRILDQLKESPMQFSQIVDLHRNVPWREFLRAWGEIRVAGILRRDEDGHYFLAAAETSD